MELNQYEISAKAGEGVYAPFPARTFKVSKNLAAANNFGPATVCKLANEPSTGLPVITPITAQNDNIYCVVAVDLRKGEFAANDKVKAWVADEVVWMNSGDAVAAGSILEVGLDGRVKQQATGHTVIGVAESSAGGAGELVAVRLTAPYNVHGAL